MKLFKNRKPYADKDYTINMLPHNRKEVFLDTVKLQWKGLLAVGLILLVCALPMHVLDIFNAIEHSKLTFDSVGSSVDVDTVFQMVSINNIVVLISMPFYVLLFVVLAGLCRIIRQYAFGENVFFVADFFKGIKQNGLQMFVVGLLFAIIYGLSMISFNFSRTIDSIGLALLFMLPIGLLVLVAIPVAGYAMVHISIYKSKLKNVLVQSVMNVAKSPFKTYLALICCLGILALQLIPNLIAMFVVKIVFSFVAPFALLGWYLFVLNRFDKTINAQKYPELVGIGTYKIEEEAQDNQDTKGVVICPSSDDKIKVQNDCENDEENEGENDDDSVEPSDIKKEEKPD